MLINEQDSELFQWCLHLLDGNSCSHSGYTAETIYHDGHPEYTAEIIQHDGGDGLHYGQYHSGSDDTEYNHVENDEIIARTLQEEFSQLAVIESSETESSEFSHGGKEHLQASIDTYDLHSSSIRDYWSAHECDQGKYDDTVPFSSCSSPGKEESSGHLELVDDKEEYSCHLELIDDSVLNCEVSKRLNQMIPIPHVPRINGDIPSIDEATSDHERLLNRLQLYDFVEVKVQGDGNCQFRALSDQLYGEPDYHKSVRRQVVNQLKSHPDIYEGYVPMEYADYVKNMSRSGVWGDHVTLQAAADLYCVKISVITSFKDTCYIEILPKEQKIRKVIFLSFWAEVHYNSIYFQGDIPSCESRKKKKWWNFGN
ncbi:OTU domain-containing protein [Cephalotus follicularis]|uniref:ubiquitinyl hydrolase 1 n=1 Tax=Cephalotus follicularis TaxID=3775 RepID=A0A1Q3C6H5_CEPFO|nr:OTU domain-containing protein [Cephalotus follicularis]